MSKRIFELLIALVASVLLMSWFASVRAAPQQGVVADAAAQPPETLARIDALIESSMRDGKIPGVAVVIVQNGQTVLSKGFGYADIATQRPVTAETLFEVGSTSKAFTALGILQLEAQGRVRLNAPVRTYLPWFRMRYVGVHKGTPIDSDVDITVEQLLHHTSGIPFETIGDIPIANDAGALERTVRGLVGRELETYPGDRYAYATINYDVLGLIIQIVSGVPFETYMQTNVLAPLELKQTVISSQHVVSQPMATGYKLGFLRPRAFAAPMYRGNAPAAYFVTNALDVAQWLNIQLQAESSPGFDPALIDRSHQPNRMVAPDTDGASYAAGWRVYQDGAGQFSHGGSNPNFSSHFVFRPADRLGVGILANLNSSYTDAIAWGIVDILQGEPQADAPTDLYLSVDNASSIILLLSSFFSLATLSFITVASVDLVRRKRSFVGIRSRAMIAIMLSLLFILYVAYCLYSLPAVLFSELPWDFISVWAPYSLLPTILLLFITIVLFCAYILIIILFPKRDENSLYHLVVLSFMSGLGNAIVIFAVSEALKGLNEINTNLFLYFILGLLLYIIGQKVIKTQMIRITNNIVYEKRVELIRKSLSIPFDAFEKIENGKIYASLSNDTETVSRAPNILVGMLTDTITLLCCFIYLGIVNIYGLLLSIVIIAVLASLYYAMGRSANRLMEQTRDNQNVFFGFINDLLYGFKELSLNFSKRSEFNRDMEESCDEYRVKRTSAAIKFINVSVIGDLLFMIVIGVVVFAFPIYFREIRPSVLITYVFVFLYMTGPINGVIQVVPYLFEIRISWNRINSLIDEVDRISTTSDPKNSRHDDIDRVSVRLEDIEYEYQSDDKTFKVGPINYEFRSGEIVFITGGNGSGKTTLAKLLTGLYTPDKGRILINGLEIRRNELGEYFSNVFSDFYLFKKLYGIDYKNTHDKIDEYLDVLQIKDKLTVSDGIFSTTKLSTGQRKRLALLVSYLEDRKIFIFDEWAADQDPEFRRFFYQDLLLELKQRGKCVIVITHDDRYFHIADAVLKLHAGQIEVSTALST